MMRISIPDDNPDPFSSLGDYFSPEMIRASNGFSQTVYKKTKLPLRIFEGARARTAEINGCMVCRAFRAKRDLQDFYKSSGVDSSNTVIENGAAPDEEFYQNITNWKSYPAYSERERLAIEYAERFCIEPQALAKDDIFWERTKRVFSDEEIVDLSQCVASFIATGRVAHVLGLDKVCSIIELGAAE
jgi:alkylhydroperoxidase family enzyme